MTMVKEDYHSVIHYTGCPKKGPNRILLEPTNLNKIECCGAKVSHGHCLVAADPAYSKKERTKKQFLETTLPSLVEIVTMYKVFLVNEGKEMTRAGKGARTGMNW